MHISAAATADMVHAVAAILIAVSIDESSHAHFHTRADPAAPWKSARALRFAQHQKL